MLPSPCGSTAASAPSRRHRLVSSRASAVGSPLTYLSKHAVVYQAISSAPRKVAPKPGLGIQSKSKCDPPRMMISPEGTPALLYARDVAALACGSGTVTFGVGGRK